MPLEKGASKEAVGRNVKREESAGKSHDQAVAIALETARRAGADIKPNPHHHGTSHHDHVREAGGTPNPNHKAHGDGHH